MRCVNLQGTNSKNKEIKQKTQTNLQSIKRQKHEKRKKTKD